jgi:hypothetical protein
VKRNGYATFWMTLFLLPLAFDYKTADDHASHLAQYLLVAPTLAAGGLLLLIAPAAAARTTLQRLVSLALLLAIPGSLVAQLINDNDVNNYLRVLLPFALFFIGYHVACRGWDARRTEQIERAVFWSSVVCFVFSFCFGLATVHGLDNLRFRIISPTFLGLQGILLHEFVIAKRVRVLTAALFAAMLVAELLSVTRSLLIGTLLLLALATWMAAPSLSHFVRSAARALAIGIVLAGLAFTASSVVPGVTDHWTQRIFASKATESGRDPTTITRLAEMKDQYDQVTSSAESILFGEGYGHYYRFSPSYLPDLAGQFSDEDFYAVHEWFPGHNFWVYQFFAGGLVFGVGLPLALLGALAVCAFSYRRWRAKAPDAPYLPVLGRAILLVASLPATSIGGNPLGSRYSGVIYGVGLGLMVAAYGRVLYATHTAARHKRAGERLRASYR